MRFVAGRGAVAESDLEDVAGRGCHREETDGRSGAAMHHREDTAGRTAAAKLLLGGAPCPLEWEDPQAKRRARNAAASEAPQTVATEKVINFVMGPIIFTFGRCKRHNFQEASKPPATPPANSKPPAGKG